MSFGNRSTANGQRMPKLWCSQCTPGTSKHVSSHVQRVPQPKIFAHLHRRCDTRITKPLPTACVVKVCALTPRCTFVTCTHPPFCCVQKKKPPVAFKSTAHFGTGFRIRMQAKTATTKSRYRMVFFLRELCMCVCVCNFVCVNCVCVSSHVCRFPFKNKTPRRAQEQTSAQRNHFLFSPNKGRN